MKKPTPPAPRAAAGAAAGKKPAKKAGPSHAKPPGEIRIIGGLWKRTKLSVADRPGLRPTPDRVRETLFNWLGQDLTGWRCIDAFAGTGALGFEAASRGAREVLMVEQDAVLIAQLKATQQKLSAHMVRIERGDALSALKRHAPGTADAVFIDPPFDSEVFEAAVRAAADTLAPEGWLYLEAPQAWDEGKLAPFGLALQRHLKAGAVHAHLLRRAA